MLIDLHTKASQYKSDGLAKTEAYFNAEQNAIVTRNAELYYRKMIQGGTATWNIRDKHMMDTLTRLMEFHDKDSAKSIVWAHNTHIDDARNTDMAQANMVNLGQLLRQQAGQERALLVGFGTYSGTVIASREWGERMEKMNVPSCRTRKLG
jgi:erythromycin esterase